MRNDTLLKGESHLKKKKKIHYSEFKWGFPWKSVSILWTFVFLQKMDKDDKLSGINNFKCFHNFNRVQRLEKPTENAHWPQKWVAFW